MCGIAGVFNYRDQSRPVGRSFLESMTTILSHRGPDDAGYFYGDGIGLGHRRLSIVDLTSTGHQPMSSGDGRYWISYNGEFYNHEQFRRELSADGICFRGTSDTETLLNLLAIRGTTVLPKLAGIFGFAFWDGSERKLLLARDPLGVKQVYYHDDGESIAFASEIKPLLLRDKTRELDSSAVAEYLHFHTPLFERTFFRNIGQLKPGEYLEVNSNGLRRSTYWAVEDFSRETESDRGAASDLRDLLGKVVAEQLMSDVPVGSFFSGGIDSTAVANLAVATGKKPRCFGVHFSGQGVIDERPFQEAAAKAIGVDLELITVPSSQFPEDLLKTMYFQDQPVIGPALLPMFYVSRLAAARVKVCLGGQAADEIFGGYARYALTHPARVVRNWGARNDAAGVKNVGGNLAKQLMSWQNLRRLAASFARLGSWETRYFNHFAKVPEAKWLSVFLDPAMVARKRCLEVFRSTVSSSPAKDPGDKAMHWDLQTYLPGLFQQDDRMSMANSLESRVPLADPRVVRFAFRLGFDRKFRGGATKWILRQSLAGVIPDHVLNRRKVGFDTPVDRWIRGEHAQFVRDTLLSKQARERGIWNSKSVGQLLDHSGSPYWTDVVWKLLAIELWARIFLDTDVMESATRYSPTRVNSAGLSLPYYATS